MALNPYTNEDGYNSLIKNGQGSDAEMVKAVMAPIGSIIAWTKSTTGCPALPEGFIECNGGTISDASSPMNGQAIPDLNSTRRFLRGKTTSGATGGSDTHTHTGTTGTTSDNANARNDLWGLNVGTGSHTHDFTSATGSTLPAYYDVVFIWRIK